MSQHFNGGGVVVNNGSAHVKGNDAVGHVQKEGIQFIAFIFHSREGVMQNACHFVEGSGQNADFVIGFHRESASECSGGDFFYTDGKPFQRSCHSLCQKKTDQRGNEKSYRKCL